MIVMKFGGTSVGSASAIRSVAEIVKRTRARRPVVVVSAVAGVTDRLLDAAQRAKRRDEEADALVSRVAATHRAILDELGLPRQLVNGELAQLREALHGIYLLRELTPRSADYVVSFGELCSSRIVAEHLSACGVAARAWPAWEARVMTDESFGEATILGETYAELERTIRPELGLRVPVVTGFLGVTREGERTTLGRGGSDYSAAILGRALGAEEIQIWTDVNGILSCDPRVVGDAFTLRYLTFAEAAELAYFGAKVLHPKTVEPAVEVGIPVRILNTFDPDDPGTLVVAQSEESDERAIEGLAVKRDNLLVHLASTRMIDAEGYLAKVFAMLADHDVSVDSVATSEASVSLTVEGRYREAIESFVAELGRYARTEIWTGRAVICVVGDGMRTRPGIAGEIFSVLGRDQINVELISQGASEINLTFVVADEAADRALRALHDRFLKGQQRTRVPGEGGATDRRA